MTAAGEASPSHGPGDDAARSTADDLLLRMLRELKRIRLVDERMTALQRQGRISFYGACTGQEAVPVGVALALQTDDWVVPALREGAVMLVRGFPLESYVAQLFGNARDVLKGRQMPSHMSGRSVRQVSWSSCIGTQLPHAVGVALAMRLCGEPSVVVGFLGDGATSTPDFHHAMTFASQNHVPCVLVCQNNRWAISVPVERQSAGAIVSKAAAYGMPGVRIDGNDVAEVHRTAQAAVERARAGGGPTLIECVTYRMGAHSSSDDPGLYRSQAEVEAWGAKDPIQRLERYLLSAGIIDRSWIAALEAELSNDIDNAIQQVEAVEPPAIDSLFDDVFAKLPWHLAEQRRDLLRLRGR